MNIYMHATYLSHTQFRIQILILCNYIFVGQPISVLDGVPFAVKDEIDCLPYPTTGSIMCYYFLRCDLFV